MASIVRVDEKDLPWAEFEGTPPGRIRFKTINPRGGAAPPVQYVEYAPGHADRVHSHDEGEVFFITAGEVSVGGTVSGPGSVIYVPPGVEYAMRGGDEGVRFFRIVVG
jgi:quercetin dioxygenase-like cupin family protein